MDRYQEQGRACYKRKDYTTALEHFTKALTRGQSVQLLDNRSACHEKLNDLPSALKDAKKSIQLGGEDPTGYLRAGRILIKMEKESVAEEIYRHGLKRVRHVGQGYELLRAAHEQVRDKLCPPKSVDPLTMLPRELAENILELLTFKQRMNACMVSKPWRDFIRSAPTLWRHLDLTGSRKKVRNAFVGRAINVARQKLTAVTLSDLFDFEKALAAIVRCRSVEDLTLLNTGLQSLNLVDTLGKAKHLKAIRIGKGTEVRWRSIRLIFEACSERLEAFEADGVIGSQGMVVQQLVPEPRPNLTTLTLKGTSLLSSPPMLNATLENLPNLRSLTLHGDLLPGRHEFVDFTSLKQLEYLDFASDIRSITQLGLPSPSLVTLILRARGLFPSGAPDILRYVLPRLITLEVHANLTNLSDLDVFLAHGRMGNSEPNEAPVELSKLDKLVIAHKAVTATDLNPAALSPRLREVKHFGLNVEAGLKDDVAEAAIQAFAKLETLDVSESSITGVTVKSAVKSGRIRHLIINDCQNVGLDAVDWARSQGLTVERRLKSDMTGAKKLRY